MGQASNNQTSRACYRQEIQNGTVYPAGWMSAMETFERKIFFFCVKLPKILALLFSVYRIDSEILDFLK